MKRWLYAACLCLISQDQPVLSATSESPQLFAPVAILGDGTTGCAEYMADHDRMATRIAWVMGYLSGANTRAVAPFRMVGKDVSATSTDVWLQNYCASNRTTTLANAAERYRQELELRGE